MTDGYENPSARHVRFFVGQNVLQAHTGNLVLGHVQHFSHDGIPDRLDLNDVNIKAAIENGVMLCIDSDAHTPDELKYVEFGVYDARRGWADAKNIVNTRSFKELSKFLPKLRD